MLLNRYLTLLFIIINLLAFDSIAQQPQRQNGMRMPAIGRIYGKIVDTKSGEPIGYATITLTNMRDSLITGALSKTNGDFSLDKLPMGRFKLKIQFMGFKTYTQQVSVSPNSLETDIGDIKLGPDSKQLNEVVISEQKPAVVIGVDRRIYNVDKDLTSKGGTAIDVMKNIPGLTVDADGNISLRNSSPTIFIDGRPSTLTLEQIPTDQLERVEVITNPSAKYDASSSGGIVNVVLKKNNKPGYNGSIGLNIGTNQFTGINRDGFNGNLNVKEGRFNFFVSYNLNYHSNPTTGYTNRTSLMNDVETGEYKQNSQTTVTRLMNNGRIGFDFNVSNRSTLTLSQSLMMGGFDNNDIQNYSQTYYNKLNYSGLRLNDQTNKMQNANSQILYKHTYPRQGKEWTADFNYSHGENKSNSLFTTTNYDSLGLAYPTNPLIQNNAGSGKNDMFNFQFDFTNPLTDTARIEFGFKSNYKESRSQLNVTRKDAINTDYVTDNALTTDYVIYDITNAAYVNYTNMFRGIGYMAGLRFEQTHFTGMNKGIHFEFIYPKGTDNLAKALFPSLYISKKIGTMHEFQVNFSRKINRPNYMQIMPYIMFSDKNNYQIGNPSLAPEFNNLIEANYNHTRNTWNILTSFYTRIQQNPITNFVYKDSTTDSNVLISTFINGTQNISWGWENTFKISLLERKMDLSINSNLFHSSISATQGTQNLKNSGISYNLKSMLSYKFPKEYTVQVNGSYEAPRIIAQGKTKEVYSIDLSFNKDFGKKMTISFTASDIFNTRGFGSYYNTETFTQDLWRRREVRNFRLSFTYRFGEWDVSLFRRKPGKRGEGQMEQMDF